MFTSTTNRLAVALPMLSAIALTLCAGAMTANAATVASTAHYQLQINLTCSDKTCSGDFPAPGVKHRLNLTQMNCLLQASASSTFSLGGFAVVTANNKLLVSEHLSSVYSSSDGNHTLNQAADIQVGATQHIEVAFNLATGTQGHGYCTATGLLDTLQ
jgi:hypothetical protein